MTTHEIGCLEQALQVLQWYRWRWRIEQLFATLKLAGLDLEATQLESISAIQRLTILALSVTMRTLQMVEGRDNVDLPATMTFSADQQECLTQLAPTLEGQTSVDCRLGRATRNPTHSTKVSCLAIRRHLSRLSYSKTIGNSCRLVFSTIMFGNEIFWRK